LKRLALLRISTLPFETLSPLRTAEAADLAGGVATLEGDLAESSGRLADELHAAAGGKDGDGDPARARGRLALIGIKRDLHNGRPLGEEKLSLARPWIRSDLAEALDLHAAVLRRRGSLLEAYRRSYKAGLAASRAALMKRVSDPLVEEGIRLAGRALHARVRSLVRQDPSSWGHDERHVAAKAVAYLSRFCTKTSPNGLFCATALAEIADDPPLREGQPRIDRVDILLNVFEASKVTACLAVDPAAEAAIFPRPNSTLREGEAGWTFWKFASSRNPTEDEVLCRVKSNPVLKMFVEESERGRYHAGELVDVVAVRCGIDRAEVARFYRGLVDRGILIAEIEIPYNERRPLRELARICRAAACDPPWLGAVEAVELSVDELPRLDSTTRIAAMDGIGEAVGKLPHTRPIVEDELFRLDAASSLSLRLPHRILEDLRFSMDLYTRLFAAMYPSRNYEGVFERDFLRKHPADTDIEFLELYRGFVEPKEGDRPAAFPEPADTAPRGSDVERAAFVMRRLREMVTASQGEAGAGEIVLEEPAVRALLGDAPAPRWSAGVLFQIAAADPGALADGRYRLALSAVFNGAGLAEARFAWLHGGGGTTEENPIVAELRQAWSCVKREGTVIAEITYNHHARTANAGLRPSIFRHEIEMPGEKASPGAIAIPLRDLVIRWDGARRRFILRSLSLDVEVLPVISSGVSPAGITSFMVNVGYQGLQPVGYFPGFDAGGVTHWPRVVCGRMVLFREKWVFRPGGWPASTRGGAPIDDAEYFLEVARWRRRHALPRHVFAHTTDEPKPRYLDLESALFVDLLRRSAATLPNRPAPTLHVTEMYPGPGDLWIADDGGHFPSEFLIQMQGPA